VRLPSALAYQSGVLKECSEYRRTHEGRNSGYPEKRVLAPGALEHDRRCGRRN
jgi:hypothetical protein